MFIRSIQAILDAFIPLSPEAAIARSLSEERLGELMHPVVHRDRPWITALFPYRNPKVRALIRAIKYRGEKAPLPALGRVMGDEILAFIAEKGGRGAWKGIPLLIPIPSSPKRLRERGYNQAERITLAILPSLGTEALYAPDVLAREERKSQVSVSKADRERNIAGAFRVIRPEKVRGAAIMLIDDVAETGTTLADARRALMESGAAAVAAFTVAH